MNEPPMSLRAIQDYLRATSRGDAGGAADLELLARFVATRDESAFELLVWRHAALVRAFCRTVLRDHHAAEDAAQAAFLVLARKGHTISGHGSVVGWLYRVARRIAVRLAKDRARRAMTSDGLERVADASPSADAQPDEIRLLCAEVDRLPERYRIPILLCFFEGLDPRRGSAANRLAHRLGGGAAGPGEGPARPAALAPGDRPRGGDTRHSRREFRWVHRAGRDGLRGANTSRSRHRTVRNSSGRRSHDHEHNDLETDRGKRRARC